MASSKKYVAVVLVSLVAFAAVGCSDSNPSNPRIPIDTAPPASPANLELSYDGDAAVLSWDPNTVDSDLAGFTVTRERYGTSEVLLSSPTMITSYQDPAPMWGSSRYDVIAVDEAGNESAVASVTLSIVQGHSEVRSR